MVVGRVAGDVGVDVALELEPARLWSMRRLVFGVGAVDVSDIAQDHAAPIDPLAIQKVDIVRGPGALRFGSQAVGGVVAIRIAFGFGLSRNSCSVS